MTATAPRVLRGSFIALACGMATPVAAQQVPVPVPVPTAGSPQKPTKRAAAQPTGDEITVTGWRLRELDTVAPTASRLNLSIQETPASR